MSDSEMEVVFSKHAARLAPVFELYRPCLAQWLQKEPSEVSDADIAEYLIGDCVLIANDSGLDEQDLFDGAMRRIERLREKKS